MRSYFRLQESQDRAETTRRFQPVFEPSYQARIIARWNTFLITAASRRTSSNAHMSPDQFWPLLQVILVDLMLAADNAIVIGLAAASVPAAMRPRVIMLGIAAAAILRILFALVTVQLLQIVGLILAGGLLLLWVCWKLWRELRSHSESTDSADEESVAPAKSLRQAIVQIIIADVSMSVDNVLAVAGIARHEPVILVFGLALSVALMAFGATLIARLLERYAWIAYIGLVVILQVALVMIWEGSQELIVLAQA